MGVTNPPSQELAESPEENAIPTSAGWGKQLDAIALLTDLDEPGTCLMAEHSDIMVDDSDSGDESISLGSDYDYENLDDPFTPSLAKPVPEGHVCSGSPNPPAGTDLHNIRCQRAAAKLGIAWPEATTSRYEGRRLPKVKASTSQLLPVFPECLEEAMRSWSNPLSAKNLAQGGLALD